MDTVIFVNPITGRIEIMPVAMIAAYVPFSPHLRLEEAAKIASIRDEDAAANLLESIQERMVLSMPNVEECGFDILSVEAPSLR